MSFKTDETMKSTDTMPNTIRHIATGLSGSKFDAMVVTQSMRLAKRTEAAVHAYLIRPVPDDPQLLLASGFVGETFQNFFVQAEKTISEFDRTARASFELVQADHPTVSATYHNPLKDLAREFPTVVWGADMAVMAHPALVSLHYYRNAVLDAIAESARPILLLPEEKHIGNLKHVMMIWRADTLHARTLSSALPMLELADQVTLLTVSSEDYAAPSSDVALQYLHNHGVQAQHVNLTDDRRLTPKLIEAQCDAHDVSLVVLGGGLQSDLIDAFVTGGGRQATRKPNRCILAIG
jgi:hypothetical protein